MSGTHNLFGLPSTIHEQSGLAFADSSSIEGQESGSSKAQNVRNRTGCLTCKRRKKKCDETKPVCKNCLRTSYVCEGYPPVRYFRGDEGVEEEPAPEEAESTPVPFGPPQGEQETSTALAVANEKIRNLMQRIHHLEQELSNVQKDRAKAAPRLPSLRSMVQPEVMKRYGQLCPTCGQVERSSSTDKETVRPMGSSRSSANSPVSTSTGSEHDTWSTNMSTVSANTFNGTESSTMTTFAIPSILSASNQPSSGGTLPVMLPNASNPTASRTACYECRTRNLQCNGGAPCNQCVLRSLPECSYNVPP